MRFIGSLLGSRGCCSDCHTYHLLPSNLDSGDPIPFAYADLHMDPCSCLYMDTYSDPHFHAYGHADTALVAGQSDAAAIFDTAATFDSDCISSVSSPYPHACGFSRLPRRKGEREGWN
jgi:hypothetical protein